MSEDRTRQLVAIMFADMVGYTALMQGDEDDALAQREKHRVILSSAVARHRGEVLQYYGDGTLSIFASAVEAVECAIELQRELTDASLIPLRIGIHTGDIVHDSDGVFGDGVNVASRIESLSAPGGVLISGKVFDEIKNHKSVSAVPIGIVQLKKVEYRLKVFAISNEGISVPTQAEVRAKAERGGEGSFTTEDKGVSGSEGTPLPPTEAGVGEAFLQRLKDRALIQWGLVYLAGAWVVLQIAGFAADRLSLSPLVTQSLNLVAFVGFFVALVVAWYHGESGRQRVRGIEVAIIAGLLLLAGFALSLLPSGGDPGVGGPDLPTGAQADRATRPSIAALPWINRSGREEDAYFTDGIHDEILTRMAKISGLRVISRHSVVQYRESPLSTAEIAQALGVRYLLEGALLRAEDSVRLSVQLIDALSDDYAWAASFDRQLSMANLLAIQAEIAQAIADALRATVTIEEREDLREVGTEDLVAYDYYLQGRSYELRPGYHEDDFRAAERLYGQAVTLDPEFAEAHAALSRIHGFMYWERFDPTPARLESQRSAAETALRLQPDLPQARAAIGWLHYVQGAFQRALDDYLVAREGMPNDADIVAAIGYTHRRLGNWPEVFTAFREATSLDPRNANLFYDLGGHSFGANRRYEEAVRAYDLALTLAPDLHDTAVRKGLVYVHWQGQLDTLRAVISGLPVGLQLPEIDQARADLALWERDGDALLDLLDDSPARVFDTQVAFLPKSLYEAWARRFRGDAQGAIEAFDAAREALEPVSRDRPNDERVFIALGFAYAGLGRIDEAEASASRALALRQPGRDALSGLHTVEAAARVLAQAGLVDEAVAQLRTVREGASPVSEHTLALDPLLDPIRTDGRFQELVGEFQDTSGEGKSDPSLLYP